MQFNTRTLFVATAVFGVVLAATTPGGRQDMVAEDAISGTPFEGSRYGWPLTYLVTLPNFEVLEFTWWMLMANVAIATLLCVSLAYVCRSVFRISSRWRLRQTPK